MAKFATGRAERRRITLEAERAFQWGKWQKEIPFIPIPDGEDWQIKVIPPINGAVVRYFIRRHDKEVSVYLDCYNMMGSMKRPYWEVYPSKSGECERCFIEEKEELVHIIQQALAQPDDLLLRKLKRRRTV